MISDIYTGRKKVSETYDIEVDRVHEGNQAYSQSMPEFKALNIPSVEYLIMFMAAIDIDENTQGFKVTRKVHGHCPNCGNYVGYIEMPFRRTIMQSFYRKDASVPPTKTLRMNCLNRECMNVFRIAIEDPIMTFH